MSTTGQILLGVRGTTSEVWFLEKIQSDGGGGPGLCVSASGRGRRGQPPWLGRVEDGLEKEVTLELSQETCRMAPAVASQ